MEGEAQAPQGRFCFSSSSAPEYITNVNKSLVNFGERTGSTIYGNVEREPKALSSSVAAGG